MPQVSVQTGRERCISSWGNTAGQESSDMTTRETILWCHSPCPTTIHSVTAASLYRIRHIFYYWGNTRQEVTAGYGLNRDYSIWIWRHRDAGSPLSTRETVRSTCVNFIKSGCWWKAIWTATVPTMPVSGTERRTKSCASVPEYWGMNYLSPFMRCLTVLSSWIPLTMWVTCYVERKISGISYARQAVREKWDIGSTIRILIPIQTMSCLPCRRIPAWCSHLRLPSLRPSIHLPKKHVRREITRTDRQKSLTHGVRKV